jgi:hypothetical protein
MKELILADETKAINLRWLGASSALVSTALGFLPETPVVCNLQDIKDLVQHGTEFGFVPSEKATSVYD